MKNHLKMKIASFVAIFMLIAINLVANSFGVPVSRPHTVSTVLNRKLEQNILFLINRNLCCSIIWTGCEINGGNPTMALFALLQTRYPFDETMPKLSSTNASSTTGIITPWKFNSIFQRFFEKCFFFFLNWNIL